MVLADGADWYKFTIDANNGSNDQIRINYDLTEGNLNLALCNAGGKLLETAATKTNSETISLQELIPGTYFVKVFGQSGVQNPHYRMSVDFGVIPPPPPSQPGDFSIDVVYSGGFTASQIAIIQAAVDRVESIIFGDLPDVVVSCLSCQRIRCVFWGFHGLSANSLERNAWSVGRASPSPPRPRVRRRGGRATHSCRTP